MNTGCFWSKCLCNPFVHNLGLEDQFGRTDENIATKDGRDTKTNTKEGGNSGNGQVADPNVETVDLLGDDAPQGCLS